MSYYGSWTEQDSTLYFTVVAKFVSFLVDDGQSTYRTKLGKKKLKEKKTLGQNQWLLALCIFKSLQHSQSLAQTKLSPRAKEFPKVLVATLLAYLWKLSKNRVGENGSVETGVLKRLEHTILTYFKIRFVDQVRKETQLFSPIPPTLHHPPAPFL
jgi:hypothetical protein